MIDWTRIEPELVIKCQSLINLCQKENLTIKPVYGFRSLEDQAKLWRQDKSTEIINQKINSLRLLHCDYLADIIENVGPQSGKWATNNLPGTSWHQWGKAVDFLAYDQNNQLIEQGDDPVYKILNVHAQELSLTSGYYFNPQDSGHIQLSAKEVKDLYTLKQINDIFDAKDKK